MWGQDSVVIKPPDAMKDLKVISARIWEANGTDIAKLGAELFNSHSNSGYSAIDAIVHAIVECPS